MEEAGLRRKLVRIGTSNVPPIFLFDVWIDLDGHCAALVKPVATIFART